jgi:uncharacterized membrane protein YgdD (TMEM256/DUF423 family)
MPEAARLMLGGGALVMALGVVLGALSAHASKGAAHPEAARLMQTAVQYQLVHGLGILLCGVLARNAASPWVMAAGMLLLLGVVLFCGSLWYLALRNASLDRAPRRPRVHRRLGGAGDLRVRAALAAPARGFLLAHVVTSTGRPTRMAPGRSVTRFMPNIGPSSLLLR